MLLHLLWINSHVHTISIFYLSLADFTISIFKRYYPLLKTKRSYNNISIKSYTKAAILK